MRFFAHRLFRYGLIAWPETTSLFEWLLLWPKIFPHLVCVCVGAAINPFAVWRQCRDVVPCVWTAVSTMHHAQHTQTMSSKRFDFVQPLHVSHSEFRMKFNTTPSEIARNDQSIPRTSNNKQQFLEQSKFSDRTYSICALSMRYQRKLVAANVAANNASHILIYICVCESDLSSSDALPLLRFFFFVMFVHVTGISQFCGRSGQQNHAVHAQSTACYKYVKWWNKLQKNTQNDRPKKSRPNWITGLCSFAKHIQPIHTCKPKRKTHPTANSQQQKTVKTTK